MRDQQPPNFDEWVAYCFTQGHSDFARTSTDDEETVYAREQRFLCMDPVLLTTYLTRLFEAPAFIAERYTDEQIAEAIWFLFGVGSCYIEDMRKAAVPPDLQIRCLRSVGTVYTDLFDRVCGKRGTDSDSDFRFTDELDGAVYMIWDMDQLNYTVIFPENGPHLVEPGLEILQTVLRRCRTSACRISALHGIGHFVIHYRRNQRMAHRLRGMVDSFLEETKNLPAWLREYAELARDGAVQ